MTNIITDDNQFNQVTDKAISLKALILSFRLWVRYLLSKWILILAFVILGGILGFWYATKKKPIYTATTTFVLEDEKGGGGLGSLSGLVSLAGVDVGGSGGGIFQGDNILGFYKSRTMLEKTLLTPIADQNSSQLLVDKYIEINGLKEKWADNPRLSKLNFAVDSLGDGITSSHPDRLRDSVLGTIVADVNKNYLAVSKPDKKLSTIEVNVKASDEIFAKTFNDALVKNVNEFYVNTKTKKTLKNVKILQHKTDSIRSVMNGAIYTSISIIDATPNLNPTRQVQRVAPAQKAQYSAESNKAIYAEMVKNLELTKMSLAKEAPLIQIIDKPIYPLSSQRLGLIKGLIIGCIAFGFLITLLLILGKIFSDASR